MYDCYLLDIEGTICPISFVKDELFPYFLRNLDDLILNISEQDGKIQEIVEKFPQTGDLNELLAYVKNLVDNDIKDPVLKELQGFVWSRGYSTGEIKAPIYEDAVEFITNPENKIYIYSSGSVKAQKLLFEFVKDPTDPASTIDLRSHISGYYDITTSGKKNEPESYLNILNTIDTNKDKQSSKILFLSDNILELDAANKSSNFATALLIRPGNNPIPQEKQNNYKVLYNFKELSK